MPLHTSKKYIQSSQGSSSPQICYWDPENNTEKGCPSGYECGDKIYDWSGQSQGYTGTCLKKN